MSKETILAKIQASLAGQGNQIDISGKLPEILAEILEEIPAPGPAPVEPLIVEVPEEWPLGQTLSVSKEVDQQIVECVKNGGMVTLHGPLIAGGATTYYNAYVQCNILLDQPNVQGYEGLYYGTLAPEIGSYVYALIVHP